MRSFDFSQDIRGVGVVLRAPLNVPIEDGVVTNTFRLEQALKTIEQLSQKGARTVVLGHIGREQTASLKPVFSALKEKKHTRLSFVDAVVGGGVCSAIEALAPGETLMLENVRRNPGEVANDPVFGERLASYGSVFINDAFSASHRSHASIIGIPQYIPGFAGPLFLKEYEGITPALSPESPNIAIVGGAKFVTKEPLIRTLLNKYDHIFIGGALAHDFFVAKGLEVGKSLVSRTARVDDLLNNSKIILPVDAVVLNHEGIETKEIDSISPEDMILDIGPKSLARIAPLLEKARFVLWNGPMGNFEKGFSESTEALARKVAAVKGSSVVGGGDTVAAIQKLGLNEKFTHVSTAGGAMLDFIADGTLAGIEVLK